MNTINREKKFTDHGAGVDLRAAEWRAKWGNRAAERRAANRVEGPSRETLKEQRLGLDDARPVRQELKCVREYGQPGAKVRVIQLVEGK